MKKMENNGSNKIADTYSKKQHIVIGGGSAGIFCALNLLKKNDVILIVDGGKSDFNDSMYAEPTNWSHAAYASSTSLYSPQVFCNRKKSDRMLQYCQGSGVGGSSNINAMIWAIGSKEVYDIYWPAKWNAKTMKKLFSRVEETIKPQRTDATGVFEEILLSYNCSNGSSYTDSASDSDDRRNSDSSASHFLSFTEQCGDKTQRINISNLLADNNANPERNQGNLTIIEYTKAANIIFTKNDKKLTTYHTNFSANGVHTINTKTGERSFIPVADDGEIVICAGAFNSPEILYKSVSHFMDKNREVNSEFDLKGTVFDPCISNLIGRNIQDHIIVTSAYIGNWNTSIHGALGQRVSATGVHGWIYLDDSGAPCRCDTGNSSATRKPVTIPRMQVVFLSGRFVLPLLPELLLPRLGTEKYFLYMTVIRPRIAAFIQWFSGLGVVQWLSQFFFFVAICLVRPHSKGYIKFDADSNSDSKVVDLAHFDDERDVALMHTGFKTAVEVVRTMRQQHNLWALNLLPGVIPTHSQRQFDWFCTWFSNTYFHITGTCAMERRVNDESNLRYTKIRKDFQSPGVVDDQFRVLGISNLRIADASVVPIDGVPNCPTSLMCMALGTAVADLILNHEEAF